MKRSYILSISKYIYLSYNIETVDLVGAQNDIERATSLAVDYISKYGMDENSAFINFGVLSEKLNIPLTSVEQSVKKLTVEIYDEVVEIIKNNKEKIIDITKILMEKEVIYEEDLNRLL